jgi:hypothetical protein
MLLSDRGYSTCHRKGDPSKPVECFLGAQPDIISLPLQARYLARQWLINAMMGSPVSIWYDWKGNANKPLDGESNFGVTAANNSETLGVPKPSFFTASALTEHIFSRELQFKARLNATLVGHSGVNEAVFALCFGNHNARGACTVIAVWASRTRPASTQAGNAICASQIGRAEDCGYWGIRKAACENRGCCFDSNAVGPQCRRPNVTVAVSIEGCFDVVELPKSEASQHYNSHRPSRQVCSTGGDRAPVVSVRASDNPVLLMNSQ